MPNVPSVAVLGGGNGAFAAAADLTLKGVRVRLLEVPELAGETIGPIQARGGIDLVNAGVREASRGFAPVEVITENPARALADADVVLYVVPAYAERRFTELCMPHFRPDQVVVFFCGNLGGALEFAAQLKSHGVPLPAIAETEALVYGAFKQSSTSVKIGGMKAGLACAALPATRTGEVLDRLRALSLEFQPATSVLETGLRNLNPVVHAPISVLNAGRTDPEKPKWRYYWEGVTDAVGRVVERVDRERLAVAGAMGLQLPDALEVLLTWYGHQGARGSTVAEVMSSNPAYEIAWAPQSLNHRFITEDVPFGLVPVEALGMSAGVPTPAMSALITLSSDLLGTDFRANGRDWGRLGLSGLAPEDVRRLVEEG